VHEADRVRFALPLVLLAAGLDAHLQSVELDPVALEELPLELSKLVLVLHKPVTQYWRWSQLPLHEHSLAREKRAQTLDAMPQV